MAEKKLEWRYDRGSVKLEGIQLPDGWNKEDIINPEEEE